MDNSALIRAFVTLDCHYKTRLHYYFPVSFQRDHLNSIAKLAPEQPPTIQEFSKLRPGLLDHFSLGGTTVYVSGAIGSNRIVVTFAKCEAAEALRLQLEKLLRHLFKTDMTVIENPEQSKTENSQG